MHVPEITYQSAEKTVRLHFVAGRVDLCLRTWYTDVI